jgi:uncharacterized membrane protein YjjB (DUF3815 family)
MLSFFNKEKEKMDFIAILIKSLWAGLFAGGWAIILTAPCRYIAPAFLCGFVGRFSRDVLMSFGMTQNWSTAVAAAGVVLVAVAIIRRDEVYPVVLITGVLPLGAALAVFNTIIGLMKVTSLKDEALAIESAALSMNIGKVVITSLAIALGLAVGMAIVRFNNSRNPEKGAIS